MIKAFNSIKEILLVFYQVLFVEAKERYEVTEFYLENSCQSDAGQFADIVAEMRAAQKCYFRTRSQKSLEKSKELEKNVDDIIAKREAMQKEKQLILFEEAKK